MFLGYVILKCLSTRIGPNLGFEERNMIRFVNSDVLNPLKVVSSQSDLRKKFDEQFSFGENF